MRNEHDLLRVLIRETLKGLSAADVALSKEPVRTDVHPSGQGKNVRVELNGKSWLTSSQAEINRVLKLGGKIVGKTG